MRLALLLLATLALVTVPMVSADDGGEDAEEGDDCVWTISYYCVDPAGTLALIIEDLKNGPPCTCDPMPKPW